MPNALLVEVPDRFETDRLVLRTSRAGDGPVLYEALVESIAELRQFLWFLPWVAEVQTRTSGQQKKQSRCCFAASPPSGTWVARCST